MHEIDMPVDCHVWNREMLELLSEIHTKADQRCLAERQICCRYGMI